MTLYRGYRIEPVGDGLAACRPGASDFSLFAPEQGALERLVDLDLQQVPVPAGPLIRCPGCIHPACECLP